ncbi:MAG: asparagine synthetase B, partial [Silvanigrellaceae bacterium]|nr:asparagine synthetase B [Silvanigrellaceae bacterium]
MCGYAGILLSPSSQWKKGQLLEAEFLQAAKNLAHRGALPLRTEIFENLYLAHFRLAFQSIALSVQPWFSADKQWTIVFNGEIYNHLALRKEILNKLDYGFLTHGDTETLLAGFLAFGPKITQLLDGEYSFVIAKTDGSELFAARCYFGVKPLFLALENIATRQFSQAKKRYEFCTPGIQFASEMKGLQLKKIWEENGFLRQFTGLYEPICTPFENIIQLPPGSSLYAKKNNHAFKVELVLNKNAMRQNAQGTSTASPKELSDKFADILNKSVESRLLSEQELAVYLSSGIDSKSIAYEMNNLMRGAQSGKTLKSFTIGFRENDYDESDEALAFAREIGLDAYVIKVGQKELQYSYEHAVYASENIQPYTNGAAKWWLSLFAKQHCSGVLTGDGADEVLGGYPSFSYAAWWKFAMRNRKQHCLADKLSFLPLGNSWRDNVYKKRFASHTENPWLVATQWIKIELYK